MKILLVTTHNLATNPRLVKELDFFLNRGDDVTVLCTEFNGWSKDYNKQLLVKYGNAKFNIVKLGRRPVMNWIMNTTVQKCAGFFSLMRSRNLKLFSFATFKSSFPLRKRLNRLTGKFDFVIAHNPGSFWIANEFASRNNFRFGADLEDYHPGETNDIKFRDRLKWYLNSTLKNATYLSAASQLILSHSLEDIPDHKGRTTVILNSFPEREFTEAQSGGPKLKLVWFSQNIKAGRGLEKILPVVRARSGNMELHLYGNMDENFAAQYLQGTENIFVHGTMSQQELHKELAGYDVGLAIEDASADMNRQYCVTNKLMAFIQAGLYVLASDTEAQKMFLSSVPSMGCAVRLDEISFNNKFLELSSQLNNIRAAKHERYIAAKKFSWELESSKIEELIS